MPRFKLTIEYAGTRYSGWQIQRNARTVQGEIAQAIREATRRDHFELYGSGRTDAGVHALAQVAHLDVATPLPPERLLARLNDLLPADIVILSAEKARYDFHARRDALARRYVYQVARRPLAFGKSYVWWVKEPLDLAVMRQAAAAFEGFHDFRGFTDDDPAEKSTTVQVDEVRVEEAGALILVCITGSHFLWKLVRRLVGVIVAAGTGDLSPAQVGALLHVPSGLPARLTAPASGLFLERVFYRGDPRDVPVRPLLNT